MAADLTSQSIQIGEVTYDYDSALGAYTSMYSNYYINANDGDIFEYNYNNADGNGYDWSLYVSNYFDNGSAPDVSPSTGGFFSDILNGIKGYVTNQDFINGVLGKATGIPVRNTPTQPVTPNPHQTGQAPTAPKKSNTIWYVVGGILVLGGIITTVILINKKK